MAGVNHFPPETDKVGSIRSNKSAQPNGEPKNAEAPPEMPKNQLPFHILAEVIFSR